MSVSSSPVCLSTRYWVRRSPRTSPALAARPRAPPRPTGASRRATCPRSQAAFSTLRDLQLLEACGKTHADLIAEVFALCRELRTTSDSSSLASILSHGIEVISGFSNPTLPTGADPTFPADLVSPFFRVIVRDCASPALTQESLAARMIPFLLAKSAEMPPLLDAVFDYVSDDLFLGSTDEVPFISNAFGTALEYEGLETGQRALLKRVLGSQRYLPYFASLFFAATARGDVTGLHDTAALLLNEGGDATRPALLEVVASSLPLVRSGAASGPGMLELMELIESSASHASALDAVASALLPSEGAARVALLPGLGLLLDASVEGATPLLLGRLLLVASEATPEPKRRRKADHRQGLNVPHDADVLSPTVFSYAAYAQTAKLVSAKLRKPLLQQLYHRRRALVSRVAPHELPPSDSPSHSDLIKYPALAHGYEEDCRAWIPDEAHDMHELGESFLLDAIRAYSNLANGQMLSQPGLLRSLQRVHESSRASGNGNAEFVREAIACHTGGQHAGLAEAEGWGDEAIGRVQAGVGPLYVSLLRKLPLGARVEDGGEQFLFQVGSRAYVVAGLCRRLGLICPAALLTTGCGHGEKAKQQSVLGVSNTQATLDAYQHGEIETARRQHALVLGSAAGQDVVMHLGRFLGAGAGAASVEHEGLADNMGCVFHVLLPKYKWENESRELRILVQTNVDSGESAFFNGFAEVFEFFGWFRRRGAVSVAEKAVCIQRAVLNLKEGHSVVVCGGVNVAFEIARSPHHAAAALSGEPRLVDMKDLYGAPSLCEAIAGPAISPEELFSPPPLPPLQDFEGVIATLRFSLPVLRRLCSPAQLQEGLRCPEGTGVASSGRVLFFGAIRLVGEHAYIEFPGIGRIEIFGGALECAFVALMAREHLQKRAQALLAKRALQPQGPASDAEAAEAEAEAESEDEEMPGTAVVTKLTELPPGVEKGCDICLPGEACQGPKGSGRIVYWIRCGRCSRWHHLHCVRTTWGQKAAPKQATLGAALRGPMDVQWTCAPCGGGGAKL